MKLRCDAIGFEFGGRHTQSEMFYAGAQFVTRGHSLRTYDWDKSAAWFSTITDRCDFTKGS